MQKEITLSKRLTKIASFIDIAEPFADIGSDHAYLPCFLCQKHANTFAVAGEVNEGPFYSATYTVQACGLQDRVDVRLGDGLEVLKENERMQVVIAGMGGSLIRSILEKGKKKLNNVSRVIAQPNIDERDVRIALQEFSFQITEETILEDQGHIYEIIVAEQNKNNKKNSLTDRELFFGPYLLKNKTDIFYKKWKHNYLHHQRILDQMMRANVKNEQKIAQYSQEMQWIKEVLSDEAAADQRRHF